MIRDVLISKGTVNASIVSPREILIEALRYRAVGMIMVHNHPSGDPTPSREDCSITQRVKEAGKLVGIQLLDHIVIGDGSYSSFKKRRNVIAHGIKIYALFINRTDSVLYCPHRNYILF